MKPAWSYLVVATLSIAVFLPTWSNDFVDWDDPSTLRDNPRLRPPSVAGVLYYWRNADAGLYIPVTYSFWAGIAMVAYRDGAMLAWPFHAASVALHAGGAMLVLALLRRLVRHPAACLLGALLFVVHPVQVETVAWASGAKDVLAGVFTLVFLLLYVCAVESPAGRSRRALFGGMAVALALGMLAKPAAIVAPVLALVLDVFLLGSRWRQSLARLWPYAAITTPCIIWSRAVQPAWPQTFTPLWTRPFIAGDAIAFYLGKLIWPMNLTPMYGRTPNLVIESRIAFFTSAITFILVAAILIRPRPIPALTAGAAVFGLALAPVLGLASLSFQLYSTVADHYLYVAMVGVALAIAGLLSRRGRPVVIAVGIIGIAAFAVRSIQQQTHWRDSVRLFSHAVACTPENVQPHTSLAASLAMAGRFDEAIPHYQFVARARPDNPKIHLVLGRALAAAGRQREALRELDIAVVLSGHEPSIVAERETLRMTLDSPTTRD